GNWMVDGMGTAFASELILDENDGAGSYSLNYPNHSLAQIDQLMADFHGITRYIKMTTLPYDGIHHIDMHMKLLDEKTILVGEFPVGISDGPQIEANIQYILNNYQDPWGNPYRIVRIPMPPSTSGNYAGAPFGNASYRTYSNFVIVNKAIIMPGYRQEYDTTAYRIVKENMPGYTITMIDADNSSANIIAQSGVIHCITHTVGVSDPLRIVHNSLGDTYDTMNPYQVDAIIQHKTGIANANVYWTTDTTQPYTAVPMTLTNVTTDTWTGYIPAQPIGTEIFYYVQAAANSGKTQVRPMPAPAGYWNFHVLGITSTSDLAAAQQFTPAFPNPSHGITCIPVSLSKPMNGTLRLLDAMGKEVTSIYKGDMPAGEKKYFINSTDMAAGFYFIELQTEAGRLVQKLAIR
ncbi:MAG: peptidylarginine deiminase-like protein, partial [Bacteroidetes bacterium]